MELTEHDASIFLDFVVREKASMNNSKIMLRLLGFCMGEVITVGRNELGDYYCSTIFESQGDIIIISLYLYCGTATSLLLCFSCRRERSITYRPQNVNHKHSTQ